MRLYIGFFLLFLNILSSQDNKSKLKQALLDIKSNSIDTRASAAKLLGEIGDTSSQTIKALIKALKDESSYVVYHAAESLGILNASEDEVIPALIQTLQYEHFEQNLNNQDESSNDGINKTIRIYSKTVLALNKEDFFIVRRAVIKSLGEFGIRASKAIPSILMALKENDEKIRNNARLALAQIIPLDKPSSVEVISTLIYSLKEEDTEVRNKISLILDQIVPSQKSLDSEVKKIIPFFKKILEENNDIKITLFVIKKIKKIGIKAINLAIPLIELLSKGNKEIRLQAALALEEILIPNQDTNWEKIVLALSKNINEEDRQLTIWSIRILKKLESKSLKVFPVIVNVLRSSDFKIQNESILALNQILNMPDKKNFTEANYQKNKEKATNSILRMLKINEKNIQLYSIELLIKSRYEVPEAISLLNEMILSSNEITKKRINLALEIVSGKETKNDTVTPFDLVNIGLNSFKDQKFEDAIINFTKAIGIYSDYAFAYHLRGLAKYHKNEIKEALIDYNKSIQIYPKYAEVYVDRGALKTAMGDTEDSLKDYEFAIKLNPQLPFAYHNLGLLKSAKKEFVISELVMARDYYTKAILEYKNSLIYSNSDFLGIYEERGKCYAKLGQDKEAMNDFSEAISLNPKSAYLYNYRALAKRNMKDYLGAIQDYDIAIQLDPNSDYSYHNRGETKFDLEDIGGSIRDYDEAIRLNPKKVESYQKRGLAKRELNKYESALQDFNQAIQLDPNFDALYYNRGRTYQLMKDVSAAKIDFKRYLILSANKSDVLTKKRLDWISKEIPELFQE